jgi:hypothetical protein
MPSRGNRKYRPAPVFKELLIACQRATRHFPGLGILPHIVEPWATPVALGQGAESELLG